MPTIRPYQESDFDSIVQLWQDCGLNQPVNDPAKDIARKMKVNPEWFMIGGHDGHRAEINYLGVHPDHQDKGFGKALMEHAEILLREVGCPKINVMVRTTNPETLAFYKSRGYRDNDCHTLGKRLEHDE